ncbi:MAG: DNA adenine methylase [Acidobacteriia bacterium]|nr:DNA adenine methylase [Terriglobia bacterium]
MPFYTPLRYPGGKRRLAPLVMRLLEENRLSDVNYVEPYTGGAAIALALLFEEYASTIHINDLSRPVFAFWRTVLDQNKWLCKRIEKVSLTMTEWNRQRAVYDKRDSADLDELGFATLFLNRTNRSGIIAGGVIGGKKQAGQWGLDARFGKLGLIERIKKVARYRERIRLYQSDALTFTKTVVPKISGKVFLFYDPPYIESGEKLYLNDYGIEDHRALADSIIALKKPWVVTYDYAAVGHNLYPAHRRMVYGLPYSAQDRYDGREVMFLSNGIRLPEEWNYSGTFALTPPRSAYPLYGKMEGMKARPEMVEGSEAATRFMSALKTVLSVPKAAVPNPFKKAEKKPRRPSAPKR